MNHTEMSSQTDRDVRAIRTARHLADTVLRPLAREIDLTAAYPRAALQALADAGLMGIAIPVDAGGLDLSLRAQAELFMILTEGCLAISFILTQHHGCSTLFTASDNQYLRRTWLPPLAHGESHGASGFNFLNMPPERAPMHAVPVPGGYRLTGSLPWVTAAHASDVVAAGAILPDLTQIMVAVPLRAAIAAGTARIDPAMTLTALTSSDTTELHFADLFVPNEDRMLGPGPAILKSTGRNAMTYVATALTIGHARASLRLVENAAQRKGGPVAEMADWVRQTSDDLAAAVFAAIDAGDFAQVPILRARGNLLSLRAAHAALIAGGGSGYRAGETAQRLYREAGFFSVWSVSGAIIPEMLSQLGDRPL